MDREKRIRSQTRSGLSQTGPGHCFQFPRWEGKGPDQERKPESIPSESEGIEIQLAFLGGGRGSRSEECRRQDARQRKRAKHTERKLKEQGPGQRAKNAKRRAKIEERSPQSEERQAHDARRRVRSEGRRARSEERRTNQRRRHQTKQTKEKR